MVAEVAAAGAAILVALAEWLHSHRVRRVASLAFGPPRRPAAWARMTPFVTIAAMAGVVWGLVTLLQSPPRVYRGDRPPQQGEQHLLVLLDVSPSMLLADAGPTGKQTRRQRAGDLLRSFFRRIDIDQYRVTLIAVYNGAMPVVVDTRDPDVVDNILDDLPMHFAFDPGRTKLIEGVKEGAKVARPWKPSSAIMIILSDGDTVPATGMPKLPVSIRSSLVVGVGDPRKGSFIDGKLSKQDVSALRQLAIRIGGTYHDGNQKHIPSDLVRQVAGAGGVRKSQPWTRREYALMSIALGAAWLALLPWLLATAGTSWRPGVPARRAAAFPAEPRRGERDSVSQEGAIVVR